MCRDVRFAQRNAARISTTGDKPAENAASATVGLEEIVVTAERRGGTVQSTPISITAITGAELQAQGITSASQVGAETPGISEHNSGAGQTEYEMRGISSSGGTSPTVGFYLDDVPRRFADFPQCGPCH